MNVMHVKTGLMLNDLQSVGGIDFKVSVLIVPLKLLVDCSCLVRNWVLSTAPYLLQKETSGEV